MNETDSSSTDQDQIIRMCSKLYQGVEKLILNSEPDEDDCSAYIVYADDLVDLWDLISEIILNHAQYRAILPEQQKLESVSIESHGQF